MATKKKKEQKKKQKKKKQVESVEKRMNIRCRLCFMVDGYRKSDSKCRHCGEKIYLVDSV